MSPICKREAIYRHKAMAGAFHGDLSVASKVDEKCGCCFGAANLVSATTVMDSRLPYPESKASRTKQLF